MAIKLVYTDIALGAAEDAAVASTAAEPFSNVASVVHGVEAEAVATLEANGWGLTHAYKVRDQQPFAFWSIERSGEDCIFSSPPAITLTFSRQYTATGLTFRFAPASGDYCRKITVVWYQGAEIKDSGTFYPDSAQYIVNRAVVAFDKIAIIFEETNLPGKRAKIEEIRIGVQRVIAGDELTAARAVHEVDLIADSIPENVLDASFYSKSDVDFIFQRKQAVEAWNDSELLGVYYIEKGYRSGLRSYNIECADIISVLDFYPCPGGLWLTDTPVADILAAIFGDVVAFEIDAAFADATLRGYIENDITLRDALQRICFALHAIADTTGTSKIRLFPAAPATSKTLDSKKTYIGGIVETSDTVTDTTVFGYDIVDERPATGEKFILWNEIQYKYTETQATAYNPDIVSTDLPNPVEYTGCYLVNSSNVQTLAGQLMAYHYRRNKHSFRYVRDNERPGDYVTAFTPWGERTSGHIVRMQITSTGLTVSETDLLLDD